MMELESDRIARGNARYSLKNAAYNVEWDEKKHPRGKDGKFGPGGSSGKAKEKAPEKKEKITDLNPTGGVFVDYTPSQRAEMELGENMTTLAETSGGDPDEIVTVYRGIESGDGSINPGDFITTNKQLAQDYAGTGKVVSLDIRLGDILDDSDEPLGEEYLYYPEKKKENSCKPRRFRLMNTAYNTDFDESKHPRGADGKFGTGGTGKKTDKKEKAPEKKREKKTDGKQTQSKEFKKWFGDSKVVDKEGNPIKVYHGTNQDIKSFNPEKGYAPTDRLGSWFGVNRGVAEKRAKSYVDVYGGNQKIYETYLKIENPKEFKTRQEVDRFVEKNMVLDFNELTDIKEMMGELYVESPEDFKASTNDLENYNTDPAARERVNKDVINSGDAFSDDIAQYVRETMKGYDGIKIEDDQGEGNVYVAFSPNQIKSADKNTGEFNPESTDIHNSCKGRKYYRVK